MTLLSLVTTPLATKVNMSPPISFLIVLVEPSNGTVVWLFSIEPVPNTRQFCSGSKNEALSLIASVSTVTPSLTITMAHQNWAVPVPADWKNDSVHRRPTIVQGNVAVNKSAVWSAATSVDLLTALSFLSIGRLVRGVVINSVLGRLNANASALIVRSKSDSSRIAVNPKGRRIAGRFFEY